eukprot:11227975-Lingulodinium_polyedra.AAC.1
MRRAVDPDIDGGSVPAKDEEEEEQLPEEVRDSDAEPEPRRRPARRAMTRPRHAGGAAVQLPRQGD